MRKNIGVIIAIVAVLLLFFILIIFKSQDTKVNVIYKNNIKNIVAKNEYSLVYVTKKIDNSELLTFSKDYGLKVYYANMTLMDTNDLLYSDKLSIERVPAYVLFQGDRAIDTIDPSVSSEKIREIIEKHLYNKIPSSEIAYLIPKDAATFKKRVQSKKYTISVFGIEGCSYCNLYLPVINKIAREKKLDIFYINRDTYDNAEYNKIIQLDFKIPAKCTLDGKETSLTKGFPKPMTIITKNGKFVDCIKGYEKEDVVLDKFKELGIIKG